MSLILRYQPMPPPHWCFLTTFIAASLRETVSRHPAGDRGGESGAKLAQGPALPHVDSLPAHAPLLGQRCHRHLLVVAALDELPVRRPKLRHRRAHGSTRLAMEELVFH